MVDRMAVQLHEAPVATAELKISLVEPLECKLCICAPSVACRGSWLPADPLCCIATEVCRLQYHCHHHHVPFAMRLILVIIMLP